MSVFELQTDNVIHAFDAGFEEEQLPWTGDVNPDDFDKNGPNRFTIWIPTEHVTVNMGNPVRTGTVGLLSTYENVTDTVQVDAGFVAQTDHHIHFHTFGKPKKYDFQAPSTKAEQDAADEENPNWFDQTFAGDLPKHPDGEPKHDTLAQGRTVLRLGTPVKVIPAGEDYGAEDKNVINTPVRIGSGYPPPYNTWNGYAMVTEGGSYQESHGNNVIVSGKADLRLVGWRRAVLSSAGDVHIGADMPSESLAALAGNWGTSTKPLDGNPGYTKDDARTHADSKWPQQTQPWQIFNVVMSGVSATLGIVAAAESIANLKHTRSPEEGKPGWKAAFDVNGKFMDLVGDTASLATTLVSPVVSAITFAKGIADIAKPDPTPSGKVTLYASDGFSAYGKKSATIHSELSTSVDSLAFTSISSNVSTSVSSLVATSVSAITTSVSGLASVSMSSQWGSATVQGKSSATLSSWGKVFVAGNDEVQVNSMNKQVFVHGKAGFYIGCGAGDAIESWRDVRYPDAKGWGMVGDSLVGIRIGRLTHATNFANPDVDPKQMIQIEPGRVYLQHDDASITLTSNQVRVGSGKEKRVLIG